MKRSLREMKIEGVETNVPFHLTVLEDESYGAGEIDTNFISRKGIIEELCTEGEKNREEMKRRAAAVSVALALSKEGISDYLKKEERLEAKAPVSNWKMAGRYDQLSRRLH